MRLFGCTNCGNAIHFENTVCVSCGYSLGYDPQAGAMVAFSSSPPDGFKACANAVEAGCNWLAPSDESDFCRACRLNNVVPDLSNPSHVEHWRALEVAKRHFLYGLMRLRLPIVSREEDPYEGLAFELLADDPAAGDGAIMTGHDNGVITINIAEADDPEREARRVALGEPLRTLIGHFRHESGHYYWNRLVRDDDQLRAARTLFGDERQDYGQALGRYYTEGPPAGWQLHYISAYASSHPWEDFAESWAHYLHIVDGLETAVQYGLRPNELFDPYSAVPIRQMTRAWIELSVAVNAVNRSIGQPDLYPFVFSDGIVEKLDFVHRLIHAPPGF